MRKSEPARLALERDVPPAELAFLILALLASEARWLDVMVSNFPSAPAVVIGRDDALVI